MKVCIAGGGKVGMYLAQSLLAHENTRKKQSRFPITMGSGAWSASIFPFPC